MQVILARYVASKLQSEFDDMRTSLVLASHCHRISTIKYLVLIKIGYCWVQPSGLTLVSLFRRFISGLVAPQCACNQIVDSEMTQH